MIAQVRTLPGPDTQPSAEQAEAGRKVAQEACDRQRAVDGCEGVVVLGSPGAPSLALTFWRDEAAMKAGASAQAEEISAAQQANPAMPHIPEPEVLEVLAGA
jgi:hypothetical protein